MKAKGRGWGRRRKKAEKSRKTRSCKNTRISSEWATRTPNKVVRHDRTPTVAATLCKNNEKYSSKKEIEKLLPEGVKILVLAYEVQPKAGHGEGHG